MIFKNYNEVVDYVIKKFPKEPPCNAILLKKDYCKNLEYDKIAIALKEAGYIISDDNRVHIIKDSYSITKN